MTTRLGFRPRPVDLQKDLLIVHDENDLDREESAKDLPLLEVSQPEAQEKDPADKDGIIPIPPVTKVPWYPTDYLPVHRVELTYQKAPRDKTDIWDPEWLEYDLDVQDSRFLRDVNQGTNASERSNAAALASTDHLPKSMAVQAMSLSVQCQSYILNRVYEYWKEKRKQRQKPMLRRLQAPTPESDNNPYLVFRQRAKPNKPQTRRRRETQEESLEKIKAIADNVNMSIKLCEQLKERERIKTQIVNMFVDKSQYQLLTVMKERSKMDLERAMHQSLKSGGRVRHFEPETLAQPGQRIKPSAARAQDGPAVQEGGVKKKSSKGKQQNKRATAKQVMALPLPPEPPQPCLPFADINCNLIDIEELTEFDGQQIIKEKLSDGRLRLRVGRCGRVFLDPTSEVKLTSLDAENPRGQSEGSDAPADLRQRLAKLLLLV